MSHSCGHYFTPQSANTLQITANARFDQNRGGGGQTPHPKVTQSVESVLGTLRVSCFLGQEAVSLVLKCSRHTPCHYFEQTRIRILIAKHSPKYPHGSFSDARSCPDRSCSAPRDRAYLWPRP